MGMKVAGRGRFNNEAEEFARFAGRWASKERRESEKEVREREREKGASRECRRQPAFIKVSGSH